MEWARTALFVAALGSVASADTGAYCYVPPPVTEPRPTESQPIAPTPIETQPFAPPSLEPQPRIAAQAVAASRAAPDQPPAYAPHAYAPPTYAPSSSAAPAPATAAPTRAPQVFIVNPPPPPQPRVVMPVPLLEMPLYLDPGASALGS